MNFQRVAARCVAQRRVSHQVRAITAANVERRALLMKIYAPFNSLVKDSKEYRELARSGTVWEGHFEPQNADAYREIQASHRQVLASIDEWKEVMKLRIPEIGKTLVAEYAHQSVEIEANPIKFGESMLIYDIMEKELFTHTDLTGVPMDALYSLKRPEYCSSHGYSATMELMNHILLSQWIAANAPLQPGTSGLSEMAVKSIAVLAIQNTGAEEVYKHSWGGSVALGEYRKAPIGVKSNPLRIFPYPAEIAALMTRFFEWRDAGHADKTVHPLILACHMLVYFLHIHPFPDGNGRVGRMIMHDYMLRQGYLPVVMQDLTRAEYLNMVGAAQDGNPSALVSSVLNTQLDMLETFYFRQHSAE